MPKQRLDSLLVDRGLAQSRERAQALIMAGKVLVDGKLQTKAGTPVKDDADVVLKEDDIPFVSRGGVKLDGAIAALGLDVAGLTCLDIGASTGGFTDCLLQRGAIRIYAIDVGHGQLDWKLRNDPRVINIEHVNARYLESHALPELADGAVIDVSFISVARILPALRTHLKPGAFVLTLVKPQFEAGPKELGRTGVITDPTVRARVLDEIRAAATAAGYELAGDTPSPLPGTKGNLEHFLLLRYPGKLETST